jgi:hypothetical protein
MASAIRSGSSSLSKKDSEYGRFSDCQMEIPARGLVTLIGTLTTSTWRAFRISRGGFYYFDDSDTAADVFSTARRIYEVREEAGLTSFKNAAVADEAVIGTALRLCGVEPLPLDSAPVNTFLGRTERVDVNVLDGTSRYVKNGDSVNPSAIHYPIGTQDGFCYLRDVNRLERKGAAAAELWAQVAGRLEAMHRWRRRKWENVRHRVGEMGLIGILPGRVLRRFGIIPELGSR